MELTQKTREEIYEIMREKTRVKSLFTWTPFTAVAASSELQGTSLEDLSMITFEPQTRTWECARYCSYPQEIVIRLNYRCEIAHLILMAKEDRFIPEVEIHIGDGMSGSFLDVDYRLAGKGLNITTSPKQLDVLGIGSYIKIVFIKPPPKTNKNPCGQVGLALLKVWGQPLGYYKGVVNEATPVRGNREEVDKVLIEMGLPIEHVNWSYVDEQSYTYAPVDDDTRQTLIDMEKKRDQAFKTQDYEFLKALVKDLKIVFDLGNDILKLKRELENAVGREEFENAIDIRNKLKRLEMTRDQYDALYETSRYEDMVIMARPSSAQLRSAQQAEDEDRRRREMLKRQKELDDEEARRRRMMELEEAERLRRLAMDDEERKRQAAEDAARRKANAENKKSKVRETFTDQKKKDNDINIKGDPLEYNDGDVDMEPYLKPLLSAAGGNVEKLGLEALRRALSDGTLLVVGVKLWSALHSDVWRHREAAAQAFLDFISGPLKPKYIGKTKKLFLAACDVALQACRDKLLQIYFVGLKILSTAMAPPICGDDIPHKVINNTIKPFIQLLIEKISELNYRARDISLNSLIAIFRHPAMDIRQLIEGIMDITEKGPGPDKVQWRIILARLEILLHIIREFGINFKAWDWHIVFQKLVVPSLFNQNPDVRLIAMEVTISMYRSVGGEVKRMVQEIEGLKPNLLQTITKKMQQIDEERGTKYIVGQATGGAEDNGKGASLEQIPETQDWSEQTPPGTAKKVDEFKQQ